MNKTKYIIPLIFIVLSSIIVSCQKEITVDLKSAESRLVIEGNISSEPGPYQVIVSKSGSYFDNSTLSVVENALVKMSDKYGNEETLAEVSPGHYETSDMEGVEGENYSIYVEAEGEIYEATEYLPYKVAIENLDYELDEFSGGPTSEEVYYTLILTFSDPAETVDFYRISIYINGLGFNNGFNRYTVLDDELINGGTYTFNLRGIEATVGDTVTLELNSIGPQTYEYFRTLNDALNSGMGSTPYNPISNLSNNSLGYFGTYTVSLDSVFIEY